jgi:RHS repeat-associated protein
MKIYAALALVIMPLALQPALRAQACYTPITSWQGSYSLNGSGTVSCNGGTCTVDEGATANVNTTSAGAGCSVASFGGADTLLTASLNNKAVFSCQPGQEVETIVGTGGAASQTILNIDISKGTYVYFPFPSENLTQTITQCDGTVVTKNLQGAGLWPITNWPLTFTLPTTVQQLTAAPAPFQGTALIEGAIVPWTFSFTLTPTYNTDDDCKQPGGSSIGCLNQSLGEDVSVVGTGFHLHYEGNRAPGAGGNSVASADALPLGGWTLSVHHAYDPGTNTLFFGDGQQRNGYQLGTPVSFNQNILLTSEDGSEVYVFSASTGRHLRTQRPLTGAIEYQFGYDTAGQLVTVTDAGGNVTTINRDVSEHPTAIVSPFGQTTTLSVDGNGFLSDVTDPFGKSQSFVNTSSGLLTSRTDANGNVYNYTYDSQGRLAEDANPVGGYTTLSRTNASTGLGYTVAQSTAMGRTSSFQTTLNMPWVQNGTATFSEQHTNTWPNGLQATSTKTQQNGQFSESVTSPEGTSDSTTLGSDPVWGVQVPITTSETLTRGNLTMNLSSSRSTTLGAASPFSVKTETDTETVNGRTYTSVFTGSNRTYIKTTPVGRVLTVGLDSLERVSSTQVGGLTATGFAYDGRGRLASTLQGTRKISLNYNSQGFLASVIDPLTLKSSFAYDADGRLVATTLPDGRVINYTYDFNGNLTAVTPPGKSAHDFAYNAVNLPSTYTPPAILGAGTTTYAYDLDRELTSITRPDSEVISYGRDTAGRLISVGTPTGTTHLTYNSTTGTLASAGRGAEHITYGYNGPLLTKSTWSGTVAGSVGRSYNSNFWVASQSINGGNTVAFQHDNDGLLTKGGVITVKRSSKNGLITGTTLGLATDSRTYNGFGELVSYTASANGAAVYGVQFTRDADGRVTAKSETIGAATNTYAYTYDLAGRLIAAAKNSVTDTYTYDTNSNRLSGTTSSGTQNGTYDAQDRLLTYGNASYSYTANGELASQTVGTQKTTYRYDVLGNLIAATLSNGTKITYLIDAENNRVGKEVNGVLQTGFLYDGDGIVAQVNGSNQLVTQFVYASRANSPDYMVSGGVTYRIFSDHLGSPVLVVNSSTGAIAEQVTYDEFGNVLSDTNPGFQPFGFAGGLYDQDTKLVRFGARDYNPSIGRWTAKDPILFKGGDSNLYGYVLEDPVDLSDPQGLECPPWIKKIIDKLLPHEVPTGTPVKVSTDRPEISAGGKVGVEVNGQTVATVEGKVAVGITTDGGVTDNLFYVDATVAVKGGPVTIANGHYHAEGGNAANLQVAHDLTSHAKAADSCFDDPTCH